MAETFTELNAGRGGSKMDERSVPNAAAGGTAHRTVVILGDDAGGVQTIATLAAKLDTAIARLDSLLAELATKTEPADVQAVAGTVAVSNQPAPLTDAQLRVAPVPVSGTVTASGPLTDAQLRASAVPVLGVVSVSNLPATQPVSGPLTDAELRAAAVPVAGPLTNAQLRASAVAVSLPVLALATWQARQATVGVAAVQIATPALASRQTLSIKASCGADQSIYIGATSAVTAATGYELADREVIDLELDASAAVWAVASAADQKLFILEIA